MGQTKVVEKRFVAMRMDEMRRKKLQWLWPQRIALGTLTVLAGDFESGKSLLAADLAARVSRAETWPDGRACLGPSEVLLKLWTVLGMTARKETQRARRTRRRGEGLTRRGMKLLTVLEVLI